MSYLEQTEPSRAELVLALAVLQRQELYQLLDEQRLREVVIDDLFSLGDTHTHRTLLRGVLVLGASVDKYLMCVWV